VEEGIAKRGKTKLCGSYNVILNAITMEKQTFGILKRSYQQTKVLIAPCTK